MQRPLAWTERLVVEEIADEVLVYDQRSDQAHCLSSVAARAWRACDGRRTVGELSDDLAFDQQIVRQALEELDDCGLLDGRPRAGLTRREATSRLAKVGAAAASAPLIYSIAAPAPAVAATGFCAGCGNSNAGPFNNEGCFSGGCAACGDPNQDPTGRSQKVSVTHPFHPWCGREFVFVVARRTWGEDRVFFFDGDGVSEITGGGAPELGADRGPQGAAWYDKLIGKARRSCSRPRWPLDLRGDPAALPFVIVKRATGRRAGGAPEPQRSRRPTPPRARSAKAARLQCSSRWSSGTRTGPRPHRSRCWSR